MQNKAIACTAWTPAMRLAPQFLSDIITLQYIHKHCNHETKRKIIALYTHAVQ